VRSVYSAYTRSRASVRQHPAPPASLSWRGIEVFACGVCLRRPPADDQARFALAGRFVGADAEWSG